MRTVPGHQLYKAFKDAHDDANDLEKALATMNDLGSSSMTYSRSVLLNELKAKKEMIQRMNINRYVEASSEEVEIHPKAVWDSLWALYREVNGADVSTPSITKAVNEIASVLQRTQTALPPMGTYSIRGMDQRPEWASQEGA